MKHLFKVSTGRKSKIISVEGTKEYALSYIAGYVQAIRDKASLGEFLKIDIHEIKEKK